MPAIAQSRIQTWRDTRDMPGYMRQIGWEDSMRYSWLFPIAFVWRHFSNEEFWTALQKKKAVLQNQRPNFACMENKMRSLCLRMCFRATCRPQQQSSRGLILRKRHQIFLIFFHKFLFRSPLERGLFVCPGLHWGLLRWVAPWRAALAAKLASLLRCPAACAEPRAALDASSPLQSRHCTETDLGRKTRQNPAGKVALAFDRDSSARQDLPARSEITTLS